MTKPTPPITGGTSRITGPPQQTGTSSPPPRTVLSFADVKAATDLAALVTECGVTINRAGMALCPFHGDRIPSLSVRGDHWRCFGCGEHGDAFDWCVRYYKMTKGQALRYLARRAGIDPGAPFSPGASRQALEQRKRKERRDRFYAWLSDEKNRTARIIRGVDRAFDRLVVTPEDLDTDMAKYLCDYRARLEQIVEILCGRDEEAILDYYREKMIGKS